MSSPEADLTVGNHPASPPSGADRSCDIDLLRIHDQLPPMNGSSAIGARFHRGPDQPHIADWFETGTIPGDLMPELGKLGVLGMHLTG